MADLNISVIARWVDRLTGPAKASAAALGGLGGAAKAAGAAQGAAAKAADLAAKSTTLAGKASELAAKAANQLAGATGRQTLAAMEALRASQAEATALYEQGRAAERAAASMGRLERMQQRGRQAMVQMKASAESLTGKLAALGLADLAAHQMERVGRGLERPLAAAAEKSAAFNERMTGLGITAEMSDRQLKPVRDSILATGLQYALQPEDVAELYTAARRSGVFKSVAQMNAAGSVSAGFMRLNNTMNPNDRITGDEIGAAAASATREYGFAATTAGLSSFYGMMNAAEKLGGGMNHKAMLEYATKSGGFLKAWGAGNRSGLADLLMAQQITKQYAHTPEEAGMYVSDLVQQLGLRRTQMRFAQKGVDLAGAVRGAQAYGVSPLETIATLVKGMTHGGKMEEVAKLVGQQQAGIALVALIQNMDKLRAGQKVLLGGDKSGANQKQYMDDVSRAAGSQAAAFERLKVAQENLAIAVGTQMAPMLTWLARGLTKAAGVITNLVNKHPIWTKAIGITAMVVAGLAIGLGVLTGAIVAVGSAFLVLTFLPALFGLLTTAAWGFAAALLANPIAWIVGGIILLGIVVYEVVKHWKDLTTWAGKAWEAVKRFFTWRPPSWLAHVASIAAMVVPGGAALAPAIAAAGAPAAPQHRPVHVEQHFHLSGGAEKVDPKALAREMHRMSTEGLNRALSDAGSE